MSFPPFAQHSTTMFAGQLIGMTLPLFLAFYAVVGGGLLDRYPTLRVGFLEFGSEWLLYMVPRTELFRRMALRRGQPLPTDVPRQAIRDYMRSGRVFVTCEGEDELLLAQMDLLGEDALLFASDMPHPELRDNAALEILERTDITEDQKRKVLCDNAIRYYGPA
jgi:predicted TIM-barrel fold metal-dependent hydrolase